jgi:membrane-associated phospholipid phosphatase
MVVFIVLIISMFWKISIHMAGIGGITALIIILSVVYRTDMTLLLCIALLLSGIIASIRLALKAHSPAQLLAGYIVGIMTVGVFLIQPFL